MEPLQDGDRGPSPRRIAGRYTLLTLLGRGASGEVWRAHDALEDTVVACKLMHAALGVAAARVRREIALLRRLRVPGVVRLLDEGFDGETTFLVMELIDGVPFPAQGAVRTWEQLVPTVLGLLQSLAQIHEAGVVHRDLKPGNVLVDANGRPTLLDFGVSWESASESLTRTGELVGTPVYVAPEQVLNEAVTPATDLYALGVMLYEALTGRRPFLGDDVRAQVFARLFVSPMPPRTIDPALPPAVDALVMELLQRDPAARPRSAREVIRRIQDDAGTNTREALRLDDGGALSAVRAHLDAGRSVDVLGPRGSGRSHLVRSLTASLHAQGRAVVCLTASPDPFGSVLGASPPIRLDASLDLADATAAVRAAFRGSFVVADDAERLDPWTLAALRVARAEGVVSVLTWSEVIDRPLDDQEVAQVALDALPEAALRELFEGPELLHHLASDAARILHRRTGGLAGAVVQELHAWVNAGLATRQGSQLRVTRGALERLDPEHSAGFLAASPHDARPSVAPTSLASPLYAALRWVALLSPEATVGRVAELLERPPWDVAMRVAELVRQGLVRDTAGRLYTLARVNLSSLELELDPEARSQLLSVLPVGSARRLALLLATPASEATDDRLRALDGELHAQVRRAANEGRLGAAIGLLHEGVLAVRNLAVHSPPCRPTAVLVERSLLELWLEVAAHDATPSSLHRLEYEIARALPATGADGRDFLRLGELANAARMIETAPDLTADRLSQLEPFKSPALERVRLGLWVRAARVRSLAEEAQVLRHLLDDARNDAVSEAMRAGWLARLCYRQGRFREAAVSFGRAAAAEEGVVARLAALLSSASAWMESFAFDEAVSAAAEAQRLAENLRHPVLEARARWILRACAYRLGRTHAVDLALLDAATMLEIPHIEALLALNESAVAWRLGDKALSADLARRAQTAFQRMSMIPGAHLARALALQHPDATPDPGELDALVAWAPQCDVPGIGIQAAGLLARRFPEVRHGLAPYATALASQVARPGWSHRAEVISVDEALDRLGLPSALLETTQEAVRLT